MSSGFNPLKFAGQGGFGSKFKSYGLTQHNLVKKEGPEGQSSSQNAETPGHAYKLPSQVVRPSKLHSRESLDNITKILTRNNSDHQIEEEIHLDEEKPKRRSSSARALSSSLTSQEDKLENAAIIVQSMWRKKKETEKKKIEEEILEASPDHKGSKETLPEKKFSLGTKSEEKEDLKKSSRVCSSYFPSF